MSAGSSRRRAVLGTVLRLLVSLVLLGWLLHNLQGGWRRIQGLEILDLVPAATIFALSTVLGACQWALLLRRAGVPLPFGRLLRLYWIGLFFNNFLPSNVGGDLVKVADVKWTTGTASKAVAGTVLDRLLGLTALAGLGLIAAGFLGGPRPAGLPLWLLALTACGLALLAALLLSRRLGHLLASLAGRVRWAGMGPRVERLLAEFQVYRRRPAFLARVLALALLVQALRVLTHVFVARALGVTLDGSTLLGLYVLIPVLGVAIVLPVSFNGLGLRELIATRLLPGIGIGPEAAFALQITTWLVQVAVSGVGGVLFARHLQGGRRE
jgi:uncharacterized protein (TIRG00374 family)